MNQNQFDLTFKCNCCGYKLILNKITKKELKTLTHYNCPECLVDGYDNWMISGIIYK